MQQVHWHAQVFGLGFTSVFEQVLEGLPEADKEAIFTSYIRALEEDPAQYKQVHTNKGRGPREHAGACVSVMHDLRRGFLQGKTLGSPYLSWAAMCLLQQMLDHLRRAHGRAGRVQDGGVGVGPGQPGGAQAGGRRRRAAAAPGSHRGPRSGQRVPVHQVLRDRAVPAAGADRRQGPQGPGGARARGRRAAGQRQPRPHDLQGAPAG